MYWNGECAPLDDNIMISDTMRNFAYYPDDIYPKTNSSLSKDVTDISNYSVPPRLEKECELLD